jgi:hypothetical protein
MPRGHPSPKLAIIVDPEIHAEALIAADRGDRAMWADHRARLEAGRLPFTTAPVVAQASRSPRQAQLRRFLRGCDVVPFGSEDAHAAGALLARSGTSDPSDSHPDDLSALASAVRARVVVWALDPGGGTR